MDVFEKNCNLELVDLERVESKSAESEELRLLVQKHHQYTGSEVAARLLEDWDQALGQFIRVIPIDYKRALAEMAKEEAMAATH
jgi:glutamate synthase domain-containing protein 3